MCDSWGGDLFSNVFFLPLATVPDNMTSCLQLFPFRAGRNGCGEPPCTGRKVTSESLHILAWMAWDYHFYPLVSLHDRNPVCIHGFQRIKYQEPIDHTSTWCSMSGLLTGRPVSKEDWRPSFLDCLVYSILRPWERTVSRVAVCVAALCSNSQWPVVEIDGLVPMDEVQVEKHPSQLQ